MSESADIVVIGSGAAGLMASIAAGRTAQGARTPLKIIALDGAKQLGAKILVAGGGRCNVTHSTVSELDYAGGSRNTIKKVLRSFTVEDIVQFFSELGVTLKREETGKLFPTTDNARTILNALLSAAQLAGVGVIHPWRVEGVTRSTSGKFEIVRAAGVNFDTQPRALIASRIILATGGMSLPKSGSDGHGYKIARSLGHSLSERIFPALVPLTVDLAKTFIPLLSGVSCIATLEVRSSTGRRVASFTNSLLCTHFGISGPCALDISRYYLDAKAHDPGTVLIINWLPQFTPQRLDEVLRSLGKDTILAFCRSLLAERLARCICESAMVDPSTAGHSLTRDQRRALVRSLVEMPLPITGDRGFAHAEVTAGGVPLTEVDVKTMESRLCPGLHLVGEILDADGRIGGFNFQWAWATGHIAGTAAAKSLQAAP